MIELRQGSTLKDGKYKIVKTLGQGSFGITYLATTRLSMEGQLGKLDVSVNVTIKEFFMSDFNSRSSDETSVERTNNTLVTNYQGKFRKEAENLAKLHHPNIVKVLEVFDENNTTYYVMEYIDGETVDDYVKRNGRLSEDESLKITSEICSALTYMHEHKMLHLDLKPKNMMRSSEGQIYLIDFGLSKQYNDKGEPESSTTLGFGTAGYAPIEQAHYKNDGSFPVTLDIYAVGASLHKMLTGETPPESSYVLNEGLSLLPLKKAGVSEKTIAIVEKAMAPLKRDRYQTVKELVMAIGNSPDGDDDETDISVEESTKDDERTIFETNHKDSDGLGDKLDDHGGYDDIDDAPSFFEKYWKYGLIGVVVLVGVYYCSNRNISQESHVDELLTDTVMKKDTSLLKSENGVLEANAPEKPIEQRVRKIETPEETVAEKNENLNKPVQSPVDQTKSEVNTKKVHDEVDMPSFRGGNEALMRYLSENVNYPVEAQENGVQGRVVVAFVVEKDGSITDVKVVRSVDASLDKEAVRVVKAMPRWNPGKLDGIPVRVQYNVPISFRLQ